MSYTNDRQCNRKTDYVYASVAQRRARERSLRDGEWFVAYECYDCGGFHIGHATKLDRLAAENDKRQRVAKKLGQVKPHPKNAAQEKKWHDAAVEVLKRRDESYRKNHGLLLREALRQQRKAEGAK